MSNCTSTGHLYWLYMAYALCGESDEILGFQRAGTTEWEGSITDNGDFFKANTGARPDPAPKNYNWTVLPSKITYYNGTQTEANINLAEYSGSNIAYTGTTYCTLGQEFYAMWGSTSGVSEAGAYIGMNTSTVPQYKFKVRRTDIYPELGESRINNDVNPAHVIYDILTNYLELGTSAVDTASFITAAEVLNTEGIGISLLMSKDKQAKDWINEILRHIDGVVYFDVSIGKYALILMRDDYDILDVPVLSESNTLGVEIERKSWADTYNTVVFKYTDIEAKALSSITITDTANKKTVGQVKSKVIEYPLITNKGALELVSSRAIKKLSYPLAVIKCKVSMLDFPGLKVGDVLNFSHERFGISGLAVRVLEIGADTEDSTIIEISGSEDIYGISETLSVDNGGGDLEVSWDINQLVYFDSVSAPRELVGGGNLLVTAASAGETVTGIVLKDDESTETISPVFTVGTLDYIYNQESPYRITAIEFTNLSGVTPTLSSEYDWQHGNYHLIIGEEIMFFDNLESTDNIHFTATNVCRGALGSRVSTHSPGAKVWLTNMSIRAVTSDVYSFTGEVYGMNSRNVGPPSDIVVSINPDAQKPYPPANFKYWKDGDTVYANWSPAIELRGATNSVAGGITAGQDEEDYKGTWLVEHSGLTFHQDGGMTRLEVINPNVATYSVKFVYNGISDAKVFTI